MKKRIILISLIVVFVVSLILVNKFFNFGSSSITSIESTETTSNNDSTSSLIIVDIEGEVMFPGVYEVDSETLLFELVFLAGGFTSNANTEGINKARKLSDGEYIYISSINSDTSENISGENSKININTATLEELETIYGIGESLAKAIIAYRKKNGNFESIEDIMNVSGIGEKIYEKIKDYITV